MEAETRHAHAIERRDRVPHERAHEVNARAFRAIVMLVDRTDLRTLALALEAAVDGAEKVACSNRLASS